MAGAPTCGLQDVKEGKDYHFPTEEEAVLAFWTEIDAFRAQLERTKGSPEYSFYDGPPFATGLPHYGHLLAGTLKDIVTRYAACTGHHVERRFGWDCHGLPVEHEIDKQLNITTRDDVLAIGIDTYNEACRAIVMRYSGEWEKVVTRMGRWIDFRNDYKTMDPSFMESVWYAFKQLFDKGLVYRGFKVVGGHAATRGDGPGALRRGAADRRYVAWEWIWLGGIVCNPPTHKKMLCSFPILTCLLGTKDCAAVMSTA